MGKKVEIPTALYRRLSKAAGEEHIEVEDLLAGLLQDGLRARSALADYARHSAMSYMSCEILYTGTTRPARSSGGETSSAADLDPCLIVPDEDVTIH